MTATSPVSLWQWPRRGNAAKWQAGRRFFRPVTRTVQAGEGRKTQPQPEIAMLKSMKDLFGSKFVPARATGRATPNTRLHVEPLEDRKLLTAGITLGGDGVIHVEGHDDASRGEAVTVRTLNNNTISVYDDKIEVSMTYGRNVTSQTFDMWNSLGRQHSQAVIRVDYSGLAGNDSFTNNSSIAATADGGAGNDVLKGGNANEVLIGGLGNDTLSGGLGNDKMDGGVGTDKLFESGDVNFTLLDNSLGGVGSDTFAGIEVASLTGGAGDNIINAQFFSGAVSIYGGLGNDTISAGRGSSFLYGDGGNDTLTGNLGNDTLYGGDGSDSLYGMGGDDYLDAGSGNDELFGGDGLDELYGMGGDDEIDAGTGDDKLYGGAGSDILYGMEGNDFLYGGSGKDYLYGGDGDDNLDGGYDRKVDHLTGGSGTDTFLDHHWHDTDSWWVGDWESHSDKIHDHESGEQVYKIYN
jgi:Ca2+-binding RTX toxin-like protein